MYVYMKNKLFGNLCGKLCERPMLRGSCNLRFENFDPETQYVEIVLNDIENLFNNTYVR